MFVLRNLRGNPNGFGVEWLVDRRDCRGSVVGRWLRNLHLGRGGYCGGDCVDWSWVIRLMIGRGDRGNPRDDAGRWLRNIMNLRSLRNSRIRRERGRNSWLSHLRDLLNWLSRSRRSQGVHPFFRSESHVILSHVWGRKRLRLRHGILKRILQFQDYKSFWLKSDLQFFSFFFFRKIGNRNRAPLRKGATEPHRSRGCGYLFANLIEIKCYLSWRLNHIKQPSEIIYLLGILIRNRGGIGDCRIRNSINGSLFTEKLNELIFFQSELT